MKIAITRLDGRSGHEAGRELLAQLYRMETGQELPEIAIASRGKPYFPNSPLHFSITHTRRHALCALGCSPVGIDAEELGRKISPALVQRCLSPAELSRYQAAADPERAFLSLWVLKEAAAKCSGLGLNGFPNHTDFSPEDSRVRLWDGCLVALIREDENEGVTEYAF